MSNAVKMVVNSLNPKIKFEFSFVASFISYRSSGEKLITYQAIVCDHVRNSHDHSVLQSIDITRRNLMLITLRAQRVKMVVP